ncbi:MAG: hypothetical protein RL684_2317 [Pseudomonadota bacterium]
MSQHDKRPARRSDDPDSTAELPALSGAEFADPDTWVSPPPVRGTLVDEVLQAHETEIQLLRRELAHSARERAAYERQYHDAIASGEEMRQQLAVAEARADELARELNELERTIEERDVRIGELQLDLDDAGSAPAAPTAPGEASAATVAAAQAVAVAAAAGPAAAAARAHDAQMRALQAELEQLRWRAAAQSEALQSREVRRQAHESQWRELDAQLAGREARIRALEQELAASRTAVRPADEAAAAAQPAVRSEVATAPAVVSDDNAASTALADAAVAVDAGTDGSAPGRDEAVAKAAASVEQSKGASPPIEATPIAPAQSAARPVAAGPAKGRAAREVRARGSDAGDSSTTGDFATTGDFTAGKTGGKGLTDAPVRMLVRTDGDAGIVHVLGRRTTIGRTPDNDLRINAEWISRHHAVVLQTSAGTVLEDLNSTNGVLVNGLRVARRQLESGDLVTFGKSNFRYLVKAGDAQNG